MAAVNFPNSPSVNDTHTSSGSTWKWDGTVWQRLGEAGPQGAQGVQGATGSTGAAGAQGAQGHQGRQGTAGAQGATNNLTIATSPPGSPTAGDLWWDSDDGDLHTYFNDGNSSQWISINNGPAGAQGAQGVQGAGGSTGAQGHQGVQGAAGAQGAQGRQGAAGAVGAQGAAGNATINNNANNRLITGSGTANTLEAEANLTYDGNALSIISASNSADGLIIHNTNNSQGHADGAVMISGGDNASAFLRLENNSQKFEIIKDANHNLIVEDDGTERLRLDAAGNILIGTTSATSELTVRGGGTVAAFEGTGGSGSIMIKDVDDGSLAYAVVDGGNFDIQTSGSSYSTKVRITPGGRVVQYTNHTSGNSENSPSQWYGDDANHYTLAISNFNELDATKIHNSNDYNSIVYKREKMTEYCDIEFTMTANAPSGTTYRHLGFCINGDGSDTWSNFDRLVIRHRPGNTNNNQIRLDKGGGGYGFNSESSSYPNFADGTERHWHIQIRKRTFVISVDGALVGSFRSNADLVRSHGFFGFTIYESSTSNPNVKIRDFKIRNYTPNSLPGGNNAAFCARISTGNPSCSSTAHDKPADEEVFDNGSNYNTSNYRFTAPHAGVYQFHQTFNVYSSPNGQWAGFKVNGSTLYVGTKANSSWGSGDQNHVASATIQLEKGDYVTAWDVVSSSSTYSSGVAWNRFEGYCVASYK